MEPPAQGPAPEGLAGSWTFLDLGAGDEVSRGHSPPQRTRGAWRRGRGERRGEPQRKTSKEVQRAGREGGDQTFQNDRAWGWASAPASLQPSLPLPTVVSSCAPPLRLSPHPRGPTHPVPRGASPSSTRAPGEKASCVRMGPSGTMPRQPSGSGRRLVPTMPLCLL